MMNKRIDITGARFGRLVAIERAGKDNMLWRCKCDCGNEHITRHTDLRNGKTKSCGCLNRELTVKRSTTHGLSGSQKQPFRLYKLWTGIKQRCFNLKNKSYKYYGKRGITVCDEWLKFMPFYEWAMSHGYRKELTIERVDNDGNYEPDNCTWIPLPDQALNRSSNRFISYKDKTKTLTEWSEFLGINIVTLHFRLKSWSIEKAFNTPVLIYK